ncbi:MAG: hypothetical protein HKN33_08235 [Pyrinomonadaceae bacterium]|nr:hypothetical protein [Pyrinomonadaceae bacterium]
MRKFKNEGFGWICVGCSVDEDSSRSRLLVEGEAEEKRVVLSEQALAKWSNREKTDLVCPKCGVEESLGD